eukprot:scaffold227463_cov35-Tisochrysis_lutea.AAC.2
MLQRIINAVKPVLAPWMDLVRYCGRAEAESVSTGASAGVAREGRSYLGPASSPPLGVADGVKIFTGGRERAAGRVVVLPGASPSPAMALNVSTYLDRGLRRAELRGEKRAGSAPENPPPPAMGV